MTKQLFMIITEAPSAEEEAAFETWYVDRHMPDVLAVPGFTAAQRFRLAPAPDEDNAPARFLTIYEMETDDACGAGNLGLKHPLDDALNITRGARTSIV